MRAFAYVPAASTAEALRAAGASSSTAPQTQSPVQFLAGGTTLLDLMKLDVMQPGTLVDVSGLRTKGSAASAAQPSSAIRADAEGLRLGAFATMAQVAAHPQVLRDYPVIAQSLVLAASAQLRNMATVGGNLLQRTRCAYFRDVHWAQCNKRVPGSGCAAIGGMNRQHAIFGASEQCIAVYPGDLAQALLALDATLEIAGQGGVRRLALADLHRAPGSTPQVETVLAPGELITAIVVPAGRWTRRSRYVKVRDRESYQFALASAAVALDQEGGVVRSARIALGGVATVPWRAREAEAAIAGQRLDERSAALAADAAFASARPLEHNAYKVALGKQTLVRALIEAARSSA